MGSLFKILDWARQQGETTAFDRIRVKTLPVTLDEMLWLDEVTPDTQCLEKTLEAVREAASEVVGRPCPF